MKAVRIHGYGEALVLEEAPVPEVGAGEVLVRVSATALNPLDTMVVRGLAKTFFSVNFPYTPGNDVAGVVEAVGAGVSGLRPGDGVIGWLDAGRGGGLAEFVAIPADACVPWPASRSPAEAAGIPIAASTAWHGLFTIGKLKAGEKVLIHAGVGGVGSFAVQFAHVAGARVIATASGDGLALVRDLGADRAIDYRREDVFAAAAGEHVELILDLVGGETQARSFDLLSAGRRLVSTVSPPDAAQAERRGVAAAMVYASANKARLGTVVDAIVRDGIRTLVHAEFPLEAFDQAWQAQSGGRARGKVIVRP